MRRTGWLVVAVLVTGCATTPKWAAATTFVIARSNDIETASR